MGCWKCLKRGAVAPQPEITLQLNTAYRQTSEFMQTATERRLHITIHGWSSGVPDEERNTMFLLHGVAGSSEIWREQVPYFTSRGYRIIAPDLIGHGLSSTPRDHAHYTFYNIRNDVLQLFDKYCSSDGRNCVIGHSYGCSFAVTLARERSSQVTHLVLISGGAPVELVPDVSVFSLPICILDCLFPLIRMSFIRKVYTKKSRHLAHREVAFSCKIRPLAFTVRGQVWSEGGVAYHNLINTPTFVIHGAADSFIAIKEDWEMMQTISNSRMLLVEDTSHMVMMERSAEVNKHILEFLSTPVIPDDKLQFIKTL